MKIIILILIILFLVYKPVSKFQKETKIAVVSMMYNPKNIETWLEKHRKLGISHFYIRLEDTHHLIEYLKSQPDVTLELGNSSSSNQFFSLMERQVKMVDTFVKQCKMDNIDYIIHIDSDEILDGSLDEIYNLPDTIDTFWMENHEAVYRDIPGKEDNCFEAVKYRNCSDENSGCASYINGKGGARITQTTGLDGGPHRFRSSKPDKKLKFLKVLHYESCDFDQYIKKYNQYQNEPDLSKIPFTYYRESIQSKSDINKLKDVYRKYRVV